MLKYAGVLAVSIFLAVSLLLNAAEASHETGERYERILPPSDDARCDPTQRRNCRKGDWVDESIADCKYDRGWWPPYLCSAIDSGGIFSWVVQPDEDDKCKPASGKRIRCGDPGTNTRCVCSDYKIKFNKCICQYWTEETPGEDQPAFCTGHYLGGVSTVHHWACCNNCNDSSSAHNSASRDPRTHIHNSASRDPYTQNGASGDSNTQSSASGDSYTQNGASGDSSTQNSASGDSILISTKSTCDGHTYQGGSSEDYCGECGENAAENKGQQKYYFSCGGCEVQAACENRCNHETVYQTWPGFCWKWLDCFKGCCQEAVDQPYRKRRSIAITNLIANMEFCGDGSCSGSETPTTCPVDCCYQINSAVCTSNATCCTPSCCQTEACCLNTDLEKGGTCKECLQFSAVLLSLVAVMALINI